MSIHSILALAATIVLAGCAATAPRARAGEYCVLSENALPQVSAGMIGSIRLGAPLAEAVVRCPFARDTVYYSYEAVDPAILFPLKDLSLLVVQHSADPMSEQDPPPSLDRSRNADFWVLAGTGAELPRGVPLGADWGKLTRALGPAMTVTEISRLMARFCELPWLAVELDAPLESAGNFTVADASSSIPQDANVIEALVAVPREASPQGVCPGIEP